MSESPHNPRGNVLNPLEVLKRALAHVPAVKYALGVAGIAAAVAIVKIFLTDWLIAVFGIIVMMILMAVLYVFAKLTTVGSKDLRLAMLTLMWSSLILTISTGSLLFTSVFFGWPINLRQLIPSSHKTISESNNSESNLNGDRTANGQHQNSANEASYLRGQVVDANGNPISGAQIEVMDLPGQYFRTATDGGFYIERIPIRPGERARVYVSKEGYKKRNEYVTVPGPVRIRLER